MTLIETMKRSALIEQESSPQLKGVQQVTDLQRQVEALLNSQQQQQQQLDAHQKQLQAHRTMFSEFNSLEQRLIVLLQEHDQQNRKNDISGLEQQLNGLLQQQQQQQQILNSLNMTVVELAQRCNGLYSATTEHDRLLQNLESVLMSALDSSGSLDVEQLYNEARNDAMQAMEARQTQSEAALQQLASSVTELQHSVNELLAQLKR